MAIDIKQAYVNGRYEEGIRELRKLPSSFHRDAFLFDCFLKSNQVGCLLHLIIEMFQSMQRVDANQQEFQQYYNFLKNNNIIQVGLRVWGDLHKLKNVTILKKDILETLPAKKDIIVFPVIWPVAFGDMIIFNQFIKKYKTKENFIIVLAPLNRPELKELFQLNDSIDFIFDLTLLPEESNRMTSLYLQNKDCMNIGVQESIVHEILDFLPQKRVILLRYFPILENYEKENGIRMWEERARLWVEEGEELPRLVVQQEKKKDKITFHFREGGYGDIKRDINFNYGQDLITEIKKEYPDYELVRLGDSNMRKMLHCRNASHENLTVEQQIVEIQQSKLYIGCHSAPQHLATACSDTPIIAFNYFCQETTTEIGDNIPCLSYGVFGKQVKKVFHARIFDIDDNKLLPVQNNPQAVRVEYPDIKEIISEIDKVLKK